MRSTLEPLNGRLINPYDSHLHWQAIGTFHRQLRLHGLKDPRKLTEFVAKADFAEFRRGEWLLGFGWDQNKFPGKRYPTRQDLDAAFPDTPVCFKRIDGHAAWVNSEALQRAGLFSEVFPDPEGGQIFRDGQHIPTGILIDLAMKEVEKRIPAPTAHDVAKDLMFGQGKLHAAGVTHIRDMSCDDLQWDVACRLEDKQQLKLAVEQTFSADDPKDFHARLDLCLRAKKSYRKNGLLRPAAVKIYYDGALGSEGAYISRNYAGTNQRGLKLIDNAGLEGMMRECWSAGVDIAVHAIGDEAAEQAVNVAGAVQPRYPSGRLHLEHAELLRAETIEKMRSLRIVCHMQPSHWLSDKIWLENKVGSLSKRAFMWKELTDNGIPLFFGSDAPIEDLSFDRTRRGIEDAEANGIERPRQPWLIYHQHPDINWTQSTFAEFENGVVREVYFRGEKVF